MMLACTGRGTATDDGIGTGTEGLTGSGGSQGPMTDASEGSDTSGTTETSDTTDTTDTTGSEDPVPEGVVRWSRIEADVAGRDIAVGDDGSIVVLAGRGYTPAGDVGVLEEWLLIKLDAGGDTSWEISWPAAKESATPVAIAVGPDGAIFVVEVDFTAVGAGLDAVRKLDTDGSEQWVAPLDARAETIGATLDGGVVVGGAQKVSANNSVAWARALDAGGSTAWTRTFGDPRMRSSGVLAVAATTTEVVLAGRLGISPDSSQSRAWAATVSLDDGAVQWEALLTEGVATDQVDDADIAGDGTILLRVPGRSFGTDIAALSAQGESLWTWTTDTVSSRSIATAPDGSFALTDGEFLDDSDPDACFDTFSPCPVAMRVARWSADGTSRWASRRTDCRGGLVATPMPDDAVLVLASCDETPSSDVAMGLFVFEP